MKNLILLELLIKVEVVQVNNETKKLEKKFEFDHKYPATKIMWVPDSNNNYPDVMVTSGDILKVWSIENNEKAVLKCALSGVKTFQLKQKKELTAPLTSFDWSSQNLNTIITCSIDTTCSIWDIQKETLTKTLIAHDKEVFDVSFSPEPQFFATVGADGSVRHFDIRYTDLILEISQSPIYYGKPPITLSE